MSYHPTFSTEETDIARNKVVYVETINAFTDISGGVITPTSGTHYVLSKTVDFESLQFAFSAGSIVKISSASKSSNTLVSGLTGTLPLFSGDVGSLEIEDLSIVFTSSNGNLFDITSSTAAIPLVKVKNSRLLGGNSIGSISGAMFASQQSSFLDFDTGILLEDNGFSGELGIRIFETSFLNVGGSQISIDGNQSFIDISSSSSSTRAAGFFLTLANTIVFSESTVDSALIKNNTLDNFLGGLFFDTAGLDSENVNVIAKDNRNSLQSYTIGSMDFEDNDEATEFPSSGVFVTIVGPFEDVNLERFTRSGAVLTYTGLESVKGFGLVELSIERDSGSSNRQIRGAFFVNGVKQGSSSATSIAGFPVSYGISSFLFLETGDEVEVKLELVSGNTDVLVIDYNLIVTKLA